MSLRKAGKKRGQALGAELFLIGVFGFENAIGGEKDDVTRSQFNGCFIVLAIANEAERDFETDGLHTPVVPAIPSKPLRNDWFIQLQPTTQPTKATALLRSSPRRRSAQRSESHPLKTHRTVCSARRLKPLPGLPKYTLTRICSVEYTQSMESVFEIIAEPNRRAILSLLVSSQQSVGETERQLRMPQPTRSKHLRALRDAGSLAATRDAQRRLYRLKPEPLQER